MSPIDDEAWSLFPVPVSALRGRPTWRLPTPRAERVIKALSQSGLPTVGDLFEISQGIQTGLNKALLLNDRELHSLPAKERRHFRQATMTDSIQNGRVGKVYWLFFPHDAMGPVFPNEAAVQKALPQYYARFLKPNRPQLKARAAILRSGRTDWWGLMHVREWSRLDRPRIITKFFGAEGAFVGDYEAAYFAVMGHVWTLKMPDGGDASEHDDGSEELTEQDLLAAFVGLVNSTVFTKLLSMYAPHVAGGQYDLSARHVKPVPLPDLHLLSLNPDTGRAVRELAVLGRNVDLGSAEWTHNVIRLVDLLYGGLQLDAF
jgi:hypothetical protein